MLWKYSGSTFANMVGNASQQPPQVDKLHFLPLYEKLQEIQESLQKVSTHSEWASSYLGLLESQKIRKSKSKRRLHF